MKKITIFLILLFFISCLWFGPEKVKYNDSYLELVLDKMDEIGEICHEIALSSEEHWELLQINNPINSTYLDQVNTGQGYNSNNPVEAIFVTCMAIMDSFTRLCACIFYLFRYFFTTLVKIIELVLAIIRSLQIFNFTGV